MGQLFIIYLSNYLFIYKDFKNSTCKIYFLHIRIYTY